MRILLSIMLLTSVFLFSDNYARSRSYSRTSPRMHSRTSELSPTDKMLFILHAQDAHLQDHPEKRGMYFLTLYNVSRDVTYFTDRPARKAGKLTMPEFIKTFRQEKPNAGLVSSQKPKEKSHAKFSDIAMTLSNPKYDKVHDRLNFDVEIIGRGQSVSTGDLGASILFIDDICPYPGG